VIFELWNIDNTYWVKLLYNDKELDLYSYCYGTSNCTTKKCKYEDFRKHILNGTFDNLQDECNSANIFLGAIGLVKHAQSDVVYALSILFVLITIGLVIIFRLIKKRRDDELIK
jgi:hypothetical protein